MLWLFSLHLDAVKPVCAKEKSPEANDSREISAYDEEVLVDERGEYSSDVVATEPEVIEQNIDFEEAENGETTANDDMENEPKSAANA